METSLKEGYEIHTEVINAVLGLREQFQIVSSFINDPEYSIASAERLYADNKDRSFNPLLSLERYRAKQSLLLNIQKCLKASSDLNELSKTVADFKVAADADYDGLMMKVIKTGKLTRDCIEYVSNCLNVLKGKEKVLKHPNGPALS